MANVPGLPRNVQAIGTEDRFHYLVFPQGKDLVRLYTCYAFADRKKFAGPDREASLLQSFRLNCLPYSSPSLPGHPLVPSIRSPTKTTGWMTRRLRGSYLLAMRLDTTIRLLVKGWLSLQGTSASPAIFSHRVRIGTGLIFLPYVEERRERMRRLRIAARLASKLRVEFGEEAKKRRATVSQRALERQLSPLPAALMGPERLPPDAFLPETIEKLIAP